MQGIVKKFNTEKGFGFISVEGKEQDIFFHYSQLQMDGYKNIAPDSKVEFDLVETDKGPQAENIVKI